MYINKKQKCMYVHTYVYTNIYTERVGLSIACPVGIQTHQLPLTVLTLY